MASLNYNIDRAGTLVASGPGEATVTPEESVSWLLGSSNSTAPTKSAHHRMTGAIDRTMTLASGEHLWLFGRGVVAVIADNPAAGDV